VSQGRRGEDPVRVFRLRNVRGDGPGFVRQRLRQLVLEVFVRLSAGDGRRSIIRRRRSNMQRGRWRGRLLFAWVSVILIGISYGNGSAEEIPWSGYEDGLKEAESMGRPVFIYFFVDNCTYCRKMDGQTLVSRKVVDYLKDGFVSVRVDAERSPQLARKYMVRGFPTAWFLTPEGKPISAVPGYLAPEDFARVLRYIGGGHYRSKSLREYLEGS
jgi:thioredoxin-related protein